MKIVDYEKRKNKELFKKFKDLKKLNIDALQNYIPIYKEFFNFKENPNINLNHKHFITHIQDETETDSNNDEEFAEKIFTIEISDGTSTKKTKSFLKLIPVIEASKFLVGKYKLSDEEYYKFPCVEEKGHTNFYDVNNISYVDSFFSFLASQLLNNYNFINALDYYGSFLSLIKNFKLNIAEDIEYYADSDFFMKNKNKLFKMDDKPSIIIEDGEATIEFDDLEIDLNREETICDLECIDCDPLCKDCDPVCKECEVLEEDCDLQEDCDLEKGLETFSESSCSSRTSHTGSKSGSECSESEYSDVSEFDNINVIFERYIVQITCLEHCKDTLDHLIMSKKFTTESEWFACLFQIIMSLIVFQDVFEFTHNDLHTNNIMFTTTNEKYINYFYKGVYYKVPTYGRIFKIIDFGRSIYKVNGKIFCSNSFQPGGDAATQYNTEPYLNANKKRIDPNFSFDLCRLACSMWDNFFPKTEFKNVARIIDEWCNDDNGLNVLYKKNGEERYPNFKLYKMIARNVHNHTPHNQLSRPEFLKFKTKKMDNVINIDKIPKFI